MLQPDIVLSNLEKTFIPKALAADLRVDGRQPLDTRKIEIQLSLDDTSCTVKLGKTKVVAVVSADLVQPYADRPHEGVIYFNVELSPMASPNYEKGRPGEGAIALARLVEKSFREGRAIDLEALCVLAGKKVWSLRVDVHVIDHDGNVSDAASLAALGAMSIFRYPIVEIKGSEFVVIPKEQREATPLRLHHTPLAVTLGLLSPAPEVGPGGEGRGAAQAAAVEPRLLLDPGLKEEAALAGSITVVSNNLGDVCSVHKAGGVGVPVSRMSECLRVAMGQAAERLAALKAAVEAHKVARVASRVRTQYGSKQATPAALASGRGLGTDTMPVLDVDVEEEEEVGVGMEEAGAGAEEKMKDGEAEGEESSSEEEEGEEEDEAMEEEGEEPAEEVAAPSAAAAARAQPGGSSGRGGGTEGGEHVGIGVRAPQQAPLDSKLKRSDKPPKRPLPTLDPHGDAFGEIAALIAGARGPGAKGAGAAPASLAAAVKPGAGGKKKARKGD